VRIEGRRRIGEGELGRGGLRDYRGAGGAQGGDDRRVAVRRRGVLAGGAAVARREAGDVDHVLHAHGDACEAAFARLECVEGGFVGRDDRAERRLPGGDRRATRVRRGQARLGHFGSLSGDAAEERGGVGPPLWHLK